MQKSLKILIVLVVFVLTVLLMGQLNVPIAIVGGPVGGGSWWSTNDILNGTGIAGGETDFDTTSLPDIKIKRERVVFFKTHKTGGSSLQNLFMRYAHEHQLLVVLPHIFNYFGHPQKFNHQYAPPLKPGYEYSIFTHHTRFDYDEFRRLFNPDGVEGFDPAFITVLREPVALFESLYAYFDGKTTFNVDLETFAESNRTTLKNYNVRLAHRIGRNQMAYDLGVDIGHFDDETKIQQTAASLDHQFDLVMIAERMEESLVLMKHLLGWTMDEVVVFHHNARPQDQKKTLSEKHKNGILRWNRADEILYNYFVIRFQQRVDAFGQKEMKAELDALRNRTTEWYEYCVSGERIGKNMNTAQQPFSNLVLGLELKNNINATCIDMTKAELQFTDDLRAAQKEFLSKNGH